MADEAKTPRKAVITKTIVRKLNTAKYETMDVSASISQEVEWNNITELLEKSENIGKLVLRDCQGFEAEALEELNLNSSHSSKNDGATKPFSKDDFDGL